MFQEKLAYSWSKARAWSSRRYIKVSLSLQKDSRSWIVRASMAGRKAAQPRTASRQSDEQDFNLQPPVRRHCYE